jgi:hypothetical protein
MNRKFKVLLSLLLAPLAIEAQESRGTILGRILDPSGAVVAGVSIQAVNADTKITLRTTSNEAGNYQIPSSFPAIIASRSASKVLRTCSATASGS